LWESEAAGDERSGPVVGAAQVVTARIPPPQIYSRGVHVFVVTEETGEYSNLWVDVRAAFATQGDAEDYVGKMAALPEIRGESSHGIFDIHAMDVWAGPLEHITTYRCSSLWKKGMRGRDKIYRVEEYVPVGQSASRVWATTTRNEREPEWTEISVSALSEEECQATFARLVQEWADL
jgi:hypothetical protein